MKFTVTKSNGTVLIKNMDCSVEEAKKMGWSVYENPSKAKPKAKAKSKAKGGK